MGIQTMGSQENGGRSGKQSHIEFLSKKGSLCSLTLNEVQNHLVEPLHTMNLDDLLKNVFPQEMNQSTAEVLDMTRFPSKKTVDEVWREIQPNKKRGAEPQWRATLGEMTLEDFLVKARAVVDVSDQRCDDSGQAFTRGSHWLQQYQQMQHQTQQCMMRYYVPSRPVPLPAGIGASNAILDAVYPDGQVNISSPLLSGRKRVATEEMAEKTVERRQKRMIKNRESAARSRARKQAYTNELENKILRLEEENERLRKQKELDTFLHCVTLPEPKQQLRRSISGPF